MGIELIAIGASVAISVALSAYAILSAPKNKTEKMSPASLDSFNVTRAQEGMALLLIYGRVRLPGNIIWYGDLKTEPIESEAGGKGMMGGGGSTTTGYRYYVSCWQAIGFGKLNLVKTYINDQEETPQADNTIYNDGTVGDYPTNVPKANQLPGCAHVYYDTWYIGDNVSSVPTVHFVVERELDDTLPNSNLATGSNPAAVIYDLLLQAGVSDLQIDLTSFTAAATFFTTGINLTFNNQVPVAEAIEEVLKYVDAYVCVNNDGQYAIKVMDETDTPAAEIEQREIADFSLNRKTWGQVPNDFHASFVDESQAYTQRVVIAQNPAAIRLAGSKITQSVDLKCYRDIGSAAARLFEVMKRNSYPASEIKFKTTLAYSLLLPGDVVRISYNDYGITNADFRITTIDAAGIDRNEVAITATQMVETLFDDVYIVQGGTSWDEQTTAPVPLTHVRIVELPFTNKYGFDPAFLILAAREHLNESSFVVMTSAEETQGFQAKDEFRQFSQYGTLAADYPLTYSVDDGAAGIEFTPFHADPQFDTLTRTGLFSTNRVAVIGDEIVAFQTVTALPGGNYRLAGIVRGVLGTTPTVHATNAPIWLAYLGDNIMTKFNLATFYAKVVPRLLGRSAPVTEIAAIEVVTAYKARVPRNPARIIATRSGSDVTLQLWPSTPSIRGAGDAAPSETDSAPPFPFFGDFQVGYSGATVYKNTGSFVVTQSGEVAITVKSRINGYLSSGKTITVGAADGEYKV